MTIKSEKDIREIFDTLSDDVLLDRAQIAEIVGVSISTIKNWDREALEGKPPRGPKKVSILSNQINRYRCGDVRAWLRGAATLI
jgi:transposase